MSSAPEPVTASQLIFTNVEADLSATRKRGFQVWLCSPDLTPEQQRTISRRLEDFRVPPGAAAQNEAVRHAFFRTPDGLYGIARTVPVNEQDRFGRSGKFHAHALIFTEDAFAQIACDPFRVIDGGFDFHSHPKDAMDPAGSWKTGKIANVAVRHTTPTGNVLDLPADRVVAVLNHIERADANPLAVAEPPSKVLAVLRGLFRALPPCARRRLEFDTLSSGATLAQLKYALVGAYSAPLLKVWSFRRYHKLDLPGGACTPPLERPGGTTVLPGELVATAGWRELSDAERDALYHEGRQVAELKLDEIRGEMLSPAAAVVLNACEPARLAVKAAAEARARKDVPAGVATLPAVVRAVAEYLDGPPAEALSRLSTPVPRERLEAALFEDLGRPGGMPPVDALRGLQEWLKGGATDPRLEYILRRWRASESDIAEIESLLGNPDTAPELAAWLRDWGRSTLSPEVRDDPESLALRLAAARQASPGLLKDARLWLALDPDPQSPAWVELRLLVAMQQGVDPLLRAICGPPQLSSWEGWLVKTAQTRLQTRFKAGWMSDGLGTTLLGLFVVPEPGPDKVILDAFVRVAAISLYQRLLNRLWPRPAAVAGQPAEADIEPAPPEPANKLYQKLADEPKRPNVLALQAHLRTADDEAFRWAGNQLLKRAYGEPLVMETLTEGVYFVGLKIAWIQGDSRGAGTGLFEAVAGAVVPEIKVEAVPDVGERPDQRLTRRLSWLFTRLGSPATTERLRV